MTMFFDNFVSMKEFLIPEAEQPQDQNRLVRYVRKLQSKLKQYLFSPCSISGIHFYLNSEDEN